MKPALVFTLLLVAFATYKAYSQNVTIVPVKPALPQPSARQIESSLLLSSITITKVISLSRSSTASKNYERSVS